MGDTFGFLGHAGPIGFIIVATGIVGIALIAERARALYMTFGMDAEGFMNKIQNLVLSKKIDEYCKYA